MTEADEQKPRSWFERLPAVVRLNVQRVRRLLFQQLPAEEVEAVRGHIDEEGALTERFVLMSALSAGIATLGLLQSSAAVVIGAMLVSPLMGPIAALGYGIASLDGERTNRAARALGIGALVGVLIGVAITGLSPVRNATPEILARTAPTLLDLAVALLSGLAGGYATVHRRGETAIGVAIATALMPPLATLGYSLAVARFDYAFGALLLFLTNLAAIAFAFAVVTRMRGVARPFRTVRITRGLIFAGFAALLLLVTPLALTLRRISLETMALTAARREITAIIGPSGGSIAQLGVNWRNMQRPRIEAIVVSERYIEGAETELAARLQRQLHSAPEVRLQQLVATDTRAEVRALVESALAPQTNTAPPVETLRSALRVPTLSAWTDPASRTLYFAVAPLAGGNLALYRSEEERLAQTQRDWRVALVPPFEPLIAAPQGDALEAGAAMQVQTALWALQRWGVTRVRVVGAPAAAALLREAGLGVEEIAEGEPSIEPIEAAQQSAASDAEPALQR